MASFGKMRGGEGSGNEGPQLKKEEKGRMSRGSRRESLRSGGVCCEYTRAEGLFIQREWREEARLKKGKSLTQNEGG